jgi:hypothetical protein
LRRRVAVSIALAIGLGALIAVGVVQGSPGQAPEVSAVPVQARPVAPGVRLTVHVFPARNGRGGGRPAPSGDVCLDGDQGGYALFAGAKQDGMSLLLDNSYAPAAVSSSAPGAVTRSLGTWDAVIPGSYFSVQQTSAAPKRPARDGVNVIGWARLVPRNTLAAAWTYTDAATGRVLEADIFFNTSQSWGVLSGCNSVSSFDVENVGTHEVGHILGLEHVSDAAKMATMYPSAPAGEVKKRTLTAGDVAGATAALE